MTDNRTKMYMPEYDVLSEELTDMYFHPLSDESVYTKSMLLSACDDKNEENYVGFAGVTTQTVGNWKDGHGLHLVFGSYENNLDTIVGKKITDKCEELGISYKWNSDTIYISCKPEEKPFASDSFGYMLSVV